MKQNEPVAFLVAGGRAFVDFPFMTRAAAERSAKQRNDGASVKPLYAAPSEDEALLREAREALDIVVRQSGYDMQLTGEELRKAEAALSALNARLGDSNQEKSDASK